MSAQSFALDIGEKYVKIADGEKKGHLFSAKTLAYDENLVNPYDFEGDKNMDNLLKSISRLIQDSGIKKHIVHLIIPDSRSYSRIVEMPYLTEKELTSAIKYQADQFIPVPMDQVSLDIEILYSNKKSNQVGILIIAAPTAVVDKAVYIAESSGLTPLSVENETTASLRFIGEIVPLVVKKGDAPSLTIFANISGSSTSLYLYDLHLNIPRDIHNFALGYDIFVKTVRANYNKSEADVKKVLETIGLSGQSSEFNLNQVLTSPYGEFVSAIEKFIVSAKVKYNATVGSIYVFGEGFKIEGLTERLTTSLGITCARFGAAHFYSRNNVTDFFKNDLPFFVPAMGANVR